MNIGIWLLLSTELMIHRDAAASAAEQILAAALGWIMRHDAMVKATRLTHQRIDVLGQQKTLSDDGGGRRSYLGLIRGSIRIARLKRRPRIGGGLPLHVGARERYKRAIPPPGGPGEAGSIVPRVEAGSGAEGHQHFRERDAALIEPVDVRLGH